MRKKIIFYNVTHVIRLFIYPHNPTDKVRITESFAQFLEYDQALIFSTSRWKNMQTTYSFLFHWSDRYASIKKLNNSLPSTRKRSSTILGITISSFFVCHTSGSSQTAPQSSNHLNSARDHIIIVHYRSISPVFSVAVDISKFLHSIGYTSTPADYIE